MWFLGVEFKDTQLLPFSISKNEVSNSEYQQFISDGGYDNPKYWDFPFQIGDKIYDFNSTISLRFPSITVGVYDLRDNIIGEATYQDTIQYSTLNDGIASIALGLV